MKNIISFFSKHAGAVVLIVALLIVQAWCELSLPAYTSDILNIGLEQSGIADGVLTTVRADSLETLEIFMPDGDVTVVESAYSPADGNGVRTLEDGADRAALNAILLTPECAVYQLENYSAQDTGMDVSLSDIKAALNAGVLTKDQLLSQMDEMTSQLDTLTDTYKTQVAVRFVTAEYQAQGVDTGAIQSSYLWSEGGMMLALSVVMMAVSVVVSLLASVVSAHIGCDLREQVYSRVMSFSSAEMEQYSTASLITRCTNDIQQIQMVCVMLLRMVAYAPVLAIGGIISVANTAAGMSWIIVLAVVVLLVLVGILMGVTMPKFKKMQTLVDRLNQVAREILTGIMPIRAFSREAYEEKRFEKANDDLYRTQLFTNRAMTLMMPGMMFVMNGVSVLIVWVAAAGIDQGTMQVGNMTAFLTYSMVIVMSFLILAMVSIFLPRAGVAADRIVEVIRTPLSIRDPEKCRDAELEHPQGTVEFRDVSFRYPGAEEDVLEHLSFTAKPGRTTAIIGATGSGKSTVVDLIARFYDVTGGSITIDGVDIRSLSQQKLRALLGYVPQKSVLFSGTVESNLKFSGDDVSDEDMRKAAEIAQASDFIAEKEEGYDAPIAQGGSNVSGGQRQRLSIARAVAKAPKIYLFDDTFSALDYKTDLKLRTALRATTAQSVVILVAQRISTILHAEQILVLEDGKLVGAGTHAELMRACPAYQEIARSQLSDAELAAGLAEAKGGEGV